MRPKMIVEPYIGEFGWELFCYQGYLRKLSKDAKIIVCTNPKTRALYTDFATEIIDYPETLPLTSLNSWMSDAVTAKAVRVWFNAKRRSVPDALPFYNDKIKKRWWMVSGPPATDQSYIKFGSSAEVLTNAGAIVPHDVIVHARNANHYQSAYRNWPSSHAMRVVMRLLEQGYSVASVGLPATALHVAGTTDLRDYSLSELMAHMNSAKVFIGSQSGPTHLATLCGLPQVIWQTCPEHATRCKVSWNPFNVPVVAFPADVSYWRQHVLWLPEVDTIANAAIAVLRDK